MSLLSVRCSAPLEMGNKETTNLEMCNSDLPSTKCAWSECVWPSDNYRSRPVISPCVQIQAMSLTPRREGKITRKSSRQVNLGQQFKGFDKMLPQSAFKSKILKYDKSSHSRQNSVANRRTEKACNRPYVPNDDQTSLIKRLHWVESAKIVDANEECNARHLEIVCKLGQVPRTADIVELFGEEIFPFITYQECTKTEWFKRNIFDENFEMKKEYEDGLSRLHWVESSKIVDANEECNTRHLEIVCKLGQVPRTADIVELFGEEIFPFITYQKCTKTEWFKKNIFNENFEMKKEYEDGLSRLHWVESSKIVDANEECNTRHLEIVCKLGQVPRRPTADIVELFGEEILPFITYQKCTKTEWFKKNIFDENFEMKEEYEDGLSSLSWVKDFYIGFDSELEKSWQIYITYAQNNAPSMVDLKKIFGVNIASFVDFIQESVDVVSKGDEESLPSSGFLRGPRSGDKLCVKNETLGCGTLSILAVRSLPEKKHYAITCYHVCYNGIIPESLFLGHRDLMADYEKNAEKCVGVTYDYEFKDERKRKSRRRLGKFSCGLYNERHDIALVALKRDLNCDDAVAFLKEKGIETTLANKKEVMERFEEMGGSVPVEKFGSVTKKRRGELFSVYGQPLENGMNRGFYKIRGTGGEVFATEGDSGSLVYMICNGEKKIPFAYLSNIHKNVYYCPNLRHSLEELRPDIKPCLRVCGFQ